MMRTIRTTPFAIAAASLFFIAACGSSPTVEQDDDSTGSDDQSGGRDGGGSGSDDRNGGGSRGSDEDGFVDDDTSDCEPVTCSERGASCGAIADGCGGVLDCGECDDDELCGVVTHNVCTSPSEICNPIERDAACDGKECGTTGDGCGGTYECGSCDDGEACGIEEPFQCDAGSTSGECAAKIPNCEAVAAECGAIGDGCGGMIDCDAETGGCEDGSFCGLGGANRCGQLPTCEPIDPDEACEGKCGFISNGCGEEVDGGLHQCPGCGDGLVCGAGGANVCGSTQDSCEPAAAAVACGARECGAVSDGCDGSVSCGTCQGGQVCRNGTCGSPCVAIPQAQACADRECGMVSDGCGGSYDCGVCDDGEACGLLEAFQCDALPSTDCIALTPDAACEDRECGMVFDGCGAEADNLIDCTALLGGCPSGEYCGVVTAFQCDAPPGAPECEPTSCAELGWECGMALDACGNVYNCAAEGRSCNAATQSCIGGINGPTACVSGGPGGGGGSDCDVCDAIPNCSGQSQNTRLTGRVITPGRSDANSANQVGVPNAFVYILQTASSSSLPALDSGIPSGGFACDRCAEQDLGPVLASDTTDALGNFTIDGNVPVGTPFVLVTKIGKFRRAVVYEVDPGDACQTVAVEELDTRLPRDMDDGLGANLPKVAVSTGQLDAMECVFEKMGVSADEFSRPGTNASNAQRFHLYRANGARDQSGNSTADSQLYGSLSRMMMYDMVVFDCEGIGFGHHNTSDPNIREYVNRGGRLFASHLSFTWLCDNGTASYDPSDPVATGLANAATYPGCSNPVHNLYASGTGIVSEGRPRANDTKIQKFITWLDEEAASFDPSDNTFSIIEPRDLATAVGTHSEEFVHSFVGGSESIQQFAFNTPYGAPEAEICGRVAYSGFHVSVGTTTNANFPNHCSGNLTDQEKILLYMLFDLGSCVTTGEPEPPGCAPVTDCTGRCGNLPDGCGGVLSCSCPDGVTCQAGGICGVPQCVPATCADEGATCGLIADGCGGVLDCDDCPDGQVCGLLTPNQCTITCTTISADVACQGKCGFVSDGCGGVHECPGCDGTLSCINGVCSDQTCVPQSCPAEYECGSTSDGCDGVVSCGTCTLPEVCGGAGEPNICGVPNCPALACSDLNAECGWIGDGCGAAVNCGACPSGQVCQANKCTGCEPRSCTEAGAECGAIGDGCGAIVQCGDCPSGQVCGAQEANKCGPPGQCSPLTCNRAGAECGLIGDGCGGTVDCGACPPGQVCGIDEAFKCGDPPPCVSDTCEDLDAECGAIANGCGGLLDCGPCGPGETCGLLTPNQCDATGTAK